MDSNLDWVTIHQWADEGKQIIFIDTTCEFDEDSVKEACHCKDVMLLHCNSIERCIGVIEQIRREVYGEHAKTVAVVISNERILVPQRNIDCSHNSVAPATPEEIDARRRELKFVIKQLKSTGVQVAIGELYEG